MIQVSAFFGSQSAAQELVEFVLGLCAEDCFSDHLLIDSLITLRQMVLYDLAYVHRKSRRYDHRTALLLGLLGLFWLFGRFLLCCLLLNRFLLGRFSLFCLLRFLGLLRLFRRFLFCRFQLCCLLFGRFLLCRFSRLFRLYLCSSFLLAVLFLLGFARTAAPCFVSNGILSSLPL